jgi:hypothetical protein
MFADSPVLLVEVPHTKARLRGPSVSWASAAGLERKALFETRPQRSECFHRRSVSESTPDRYGQTGYGTPEPSTCRMSRISPAE